MYYSFDISLFSVSIKEIVFSSWQLKLFRTRQASGPTSMNFFQQLKQLYRSELTSIETCQLRPTGTWVRPKRETPRRRTLKIMTPMRQPFLIIRFEYWFQNLFFQNPHYFYSAFYPWMQQSTSNLPLLLLSSSIIKNTMYAVI